MLHVAQCDRSVPIDTTVGVAGAVAWVAELDMGRTRGSAPRRASVGARVRGVV